MITQKLGDYTLFKKVFDLIKAKEHLTMEGLNKVVGIRASLNTGLNDNLKEAFPQAISVERPLVVDKTVPNPDWFAGFSSAEACFLVNIKESTTHSAGYQVWLSFTLTQHNRDDDEKFWNLLGMWKFWKNFPREGGYFYCKKILR